MLAAKFPPTILSMSDSLSLWVGEICGLERALLVANVWYFLSPSRAISVKIEREFCELPPSICKKSTNLKGYQAGKITLLFQCDKDRREMK